MIPFLRSFFRPARPVHVHVLNTYKTKRTDLEQKRAVTHLKLAAELNRPFPLRERPREDELVRAAEENKRG